MSVRNSHGNQGTIGRIAACALLPGIVPRLNRISFSIQQMLFSFVRLFGMMGLIEKNHPCLRYENIGRYRFSHILIYAWQNLEFKRENLPKILMFGAVCLTILLVTALLFVFVMQVLFHIGASQAQYLYFDTPVQADTGIAYDKDRDWVFRFLQRIFGDNGIITVWRTDNSPAVRAFNPFFTAIFTGLLKAYSTALISIAAIMIVYVLGSAVVDAAKTGKPFGESFDGIWTPIRIAIGLFLLVPIVGSNYNAAQLLVFQASEWGGNLANNVWLRAIHAMTELDDDVKDPKAKKNNAQFIGATSMENGHRFVRDMFLIHLCMKGYNLIQCSLDADAKPIVMTVDTDDTSVIYRFGLEKDINGYSESPSYCGEVRFSGPTFVPPGAPGNDTNSHNSMDFWPNVVANGYASGVNNLAALDYSMAAVADKMVAAYKEDETKADFSKIAGATEIKQWIDEYRKTAYGLDANGRIFGAYATQQNAYNQWIMRALEQDALYGWGTAGVFYLRMTMAMSMASKVVERPPTVKKYPINLTHMYATASNETISNREGSQFCRVKHYILDDSFCDSASTPQRLYALLSKGYEWFSTAPAANSIVYQELGGTHYTDEMRIAQRESPNDGDQQSAFQTIYSSLNEMSKISVSDLHPLGTVISWGNTFMQTAFKAYLISIVAGIIASAASALTFGLMHFGSPVSTIATTIGHLFLLPGFILAFVVPFVPAFYFMFAVLEWIISIVEAVIAMPLWALSFITAEGDLLGQGMEGAKRLFEIVIRPFIIVFSLIAAILLFTAGVTFINEAYALYIGVYNSTAEVSSGPVTSMSAALGAALIYMFLVYSYATSCFKLIDSIPEHVIEWLRLPTGFNKFIRAGHHQFKNKIVEGMIIKQMISKFTATVGQGKQGIQDLKKLIKG